MLDTHEIEDFYTRIRVVSSKGFALGPDEDIGELVKPEDMPKPGEVSVYPLRPEIEVIEEKPASSFAVIETEGKVHVYPLSFFEDVVAGKYAASSIPDDVLRVIIDEWLDGLPEPAGVTVAGPAVGYDEDNE